MITKKIFIRLMTREVFLKKLGENIVKLREQRGFSQVELAVRLGKDRQNMSRLEKGRQNPTACMLLELSEVLGVPVKDLLDF